MWKQVKLEEGVARLEGGIEKARLILDGVPTSALFTIGDQMKLYDCVYSMCVQLPPFDYSKELYELHKKALEESISSKVLPSLVNKNGAALLLELCNMWVKYKVMVKLLGVIFQYLDRHHTHWKPAESVRDVSIRYFRDMVFSGSYQRFVDAAINLINQDDLESVDKSSLKQFSTFLVEIGEKGPTSYYDYFEKAVVENTAYCYHHLASQWLSCFSSADYLRKVQWCLDHEKERAVEFLRETSVKKLLQAIQWQLLGQTENILIQKQKDEGIRFNSISVNLQGLIAGCDNLSLGDRSSSS